MATSVTVSRTLFDGLDADRDDVFGLVLSVSLPLAVFVILDGVGGVLGVVPLFFSPFGLPGWVGAVLHLMALPLMGMARWMVVQRGSKGQRAGWWVVATMAATMVFPYAVMPLDALMLGLAAFGLLLLSLGATVRVAAVDPRAAAIMAPSLAWFGFSAFVGLSFAAAWSPPFAVTNSPGAA